jgi:hypothetical protein
MFHEDTNLMRQVLKDIFGQSGSIVNDAVVQTETTLGQTYVLRFKLPNNNQQFVQYNVLLTDGTINSSFGTQNLLDLTFRVLYE